MKSIKIVLSFIIFVSLFSCKSNTDKIIGNWLSETCYEKNGNTIIIKISTTYLSNKTFSETGDYGNKFQLVLAGTWDIKNGVLESIVTSSNDTEFIPVGYSS